MTDIPAYRLSDILRERGGDYELVVFHRDAAAWLESQLFDKRGNPYLKCLASGQERRAYPEEKDLILDLENLVLANAGVDAFEEVFKLIYARLYDEWRASRPGGKYLQFRVLDEDEQSLYNRINGLFKAAKEQWRGVFLEGEKI